METIVIGAGVAGLSSGIALLEAGVPHVRIWARDFSPNTTSDIAAAIWHPYLSAVSARMLHWAQVTYAELMELSSDPSTGILLREGLEIFREHVRDPWWKDAAPGLRHLAPHEMPPGYNGAYHFTVPIVEMPIYLYWLQQRFQQLGGRLQQRNVTHIDEALAEADHVLNCTGLGARDLVSDKSVYPIRGQILRVRRPEGVQRFLLDELGPDGVTYIIPRSQDVVLGGTAEENEESLQPNAFALTAIRQRAAVLEPLLANAEPLSVAVGLRPARHAVRLEAEPMGDGKTLFHNYGHGGSGLTLSWGCARDVARLVAEARV